MSLEEYLLLPTLSRVYWYNPKDQSVIVRERAEWMTDCSFHCNKRLRAIFKLNTVDRLFSVGWPNYATTDTAEHNWQSQSRRIKKPNPISVNNNLGCGLRKMDCSARRYTPLVRSHTNSHSPSYQASGTERQNALWESDPSISYILDVPPCSSIEFRVPIK